MIINGRNPVTRLVSRTHRVAIHWLCDRIDMDPSIQIKFVDTKNQLAGILTEGSFTRDKWNHLLFLLNSMNLSMFSCSHFFLSSRKQTVDSAMSNRRQEESSEENVSPTAKPKPRSVNLVKTVFALAFGNKLQTRVHTQPNNLKCGGRNLLKHKKKRVNAHTRHAPGNRGRVLANIALKEILVT